MNTTVSQVVAVDRFYRMCRLFHIPATVLAFLSQLHHYLIVRSVCRVC